MNDRNYWCIRKCKEIRKDKTPIFVEFYGLTGGGKSTVCNALSKILIEDDLSVERFDVFFNQTSKRKFWRLKLMFYTGIVNNLITMLRILWVYFKIDKKRRGDIKHCRFVLVNFMMAKYILSTLECNVILCDQGLIQSIVSLFYDRCIDNNYVVKEVIDCLGKKISYNWQIIKVENKSEIVEERIASRITKESRLDFLNVKEVRNILLTQKSNFKLIEKFCSTYQQYIIDTNNAPEENAIKIYGILKDYPGGNLT